MAARLTVESDERFARAMSGSASVAVRLPVRAWWRSTTGDASGSCCCRRSMSAEFAAKPRPVFTTAAWWKQQLREIDWSIVLMILIIKALVLGFAVVSVETLFDQKPNWHQMWSRWDAVHYLALAENGYTRPGEKGHVALVFYPLYPWLTRIAAFFTRDYLAGGFVVSGIASVASGLLLQRLVALDFPAAVARSAVWFLFIFPTSYFLHISYTESLFIALTLGCVLAARSDRWLLAVSSLGSPVSRA
jgi:hypothetical protein